MDEPIYWYRYDGYPEKEDHFWHLGIVKKFTKVPHLSRYRVVKETPKGVWLIEVGRFGHFVLRDSHKQWACPTRKEAFESYRARKTREHEIHEARMKKAAVALEWADQVTGDMIENTSVW